MTKPGTEASSAHIAIGQMAGRDDVEAQSSSKVGSWKVVESIQTKNCIAPPFMNKTQDILIINLTLASPLCFES